jgi:hypothetical protein
MGLLKNGLGPDDVICGKRVNLLAGLSQFAGLLRFICGGLGIRDSPHRLHCTMVSRGAWNWEIKGLFGGDLVMFCRPNDANK